jgi:hypothetical protein
LFTRWSSVRQPDEKHSRASFRIRSGAESTVLGVLRLI